MPHCTNVCFSSPTTLADDIVISSGTYHCYPKGHNFHLYNSNRVTKCIMPTRLLPEKRKVVKSSMLSSQLVYLSLKLQKDDTEDYPGFTDKRFLLPFYLILFYSIFNSIVLVYEKRRWYWTDIHIASLTFSYTLLAMIRLTICITHLSGL